MDTYHKVLDEMKEALADENRKGFDLGVKAGHKKAAQEATDLVNKERAALIDQGREQGRNEVQHLIDEAREEGRLQGVQDGIAQAEVTTITKVQNEARKEGHRIGRKEGYKAGRGEGYKAGWNDAIATPARDHKPK